MIRYVVLIGVVAFGSSLRADEQTDKGAAAVIQKAIRAHYRGELRGDKEENAPAKYLAGRISFTGKTKSGEAWVAFTEDVAFMAPDKLKRDLELQLGDKKTRVSVRMHGKKISVQVNGKECNEATKRQLKNADFLIMIGHLVPLMSETDKFKLSMLREIEVNRKAAAGVLVRSEGHPDVKLYFDKETGLLAKLQHEGIDPRTEKKYTEEIRFTDYKPVQGVATQHKIIIHRDGKPHTELQVQKVRYLEKIDAKEFER